MSSSEKHIYEFGEFRLDTAERLLLHNGKPVVLPPKVFDTLVVLVENSGHLLDKERLMHELWPDAFVEEVNLSVNISSLRRVLGESASGGHYIDTVPKRGYRFAADVRELEGASADLLVHNRIRARIVSEEVETRTPAEGAELTDAKHASALIAASSSRADGTWKIVPAVLGASVLVLGLMLASVYFRNSIWKSPASSARVNSMAVLPFKSLGQPGDDQYLELGIADDLINKLSSLKQVVVRPTSSVRRYTDPGLDPVAAGRELKVDSVLEGNMQRLGDRIRVTVRLVTVPDGRALWSGKFEENQRDLFAVEDSISERVAEALTPQLTGEERKLLAKHGTESSDAHEAYLKGRFFWNKRTADGINKAITYFQKAIEIEPNYALAYVGLADCYIVLEEYAGRPASETLPKAKTYAERALQLDETLAEGHASLGLIYHNLWQFGEAEKEFQHAITLNPNYPTAHHWHSYHLLTIGRRDESLAEIKRAEELDPLSVIIGDNLVLAYFLRRDFAAAFAQAGRMIELDPNFPDAHQQLGKVYLEEQRYPEALTEFQKGVDLSGRGSPYLTYLGYCDALEGKRTEALALAKELEQKYQKREASGYDIAGVYAGLGDKDRAFAWLEKVFQTRGSLLTNITFEPAFDSLRSDPRYADLLQRMGISTGS